MATTVGPQGPSRRLTLTFFPGYVLYALYSHIPCSWLIGFSAEGVVQLETLAIGTQLAAGLGTPIRTAISTLFDANRWMIFRNTVSNRIHWDFVRLIQACA